MAKPIAASDCQPPHRRGIELRIHRLGTRQRMVNTQIAGMRPHQTGSATVAPIRDVPTHRVAVERITALDAQAQVRSGPERRATPFSDGGNGRRERLKPQRGDCLASRTRRASVAGSSRRFYPCFYPRSYLRSHPAHPSADDGSRARHRRQASRQPNQAPGTRGPSGSTTAACVVRRAARQPTSAAAPNCIIRRHASAADTTRCCCMFAAIFEN